MKAIYKILKFIAALVFAYLCIAIITGIIAAVGIGIAQFVMWEFALPDLFWFRLWAAVALVLTVGLMFDKDSEGTRLWRKMID